MPPFNWHFFCTLINFLLDKDEETTIRISYFFKKTPLDRGKALRLDLMVIYNKNAFLKAKKFEKYSNFPNHKFDCYLYKFKPGFDRSKAVVAVVQILRN